MFESRRASSEVSSFPSQSPLVSLSRIELERRLTAHQNIVDDSLLLVHARAARDQDLRVLMTHGRVVLDAGTWDVPIGYLVEASAVFVQEAKLLVRQ